MISIKYDWNINTASNTWQGNTRSYAYISLDSNPEIQFWDLFPWSDYHDWYVDFNGSNIRGLTCFSAMKLWLSKIIEAKKWDILTYVSETWEWLILVYTYVDWINDRLHIEYTDPEAYTEDIPPVDWNVNKLQLIEEIYMSLVDQISKYYERKERYRWGQKWAESREFSLYNFFDDRIEEYLIENWVKDVKERVQKAKDRIWDESKLFTDL